MTTTRAILVAGLGFGDEGKGTTVDYLTRAHGARLVVRYNGGAQAAHNVVTPDGRHHTFAQFGSGTLAGARTHLSRFMIVNPHALLVEAAHLEGLGVRSPLAQLTIDPSALVTTPFHIVANRLREALREEKHGSTGMGIGETVEHALAFPDDALYVRDLGEPAVVHRKFVRIRERYLSGFPQLQEDRRFMDVDQIAWTHERYLELARSVALIEDEALRPLLELTGTTIFEGAQGVLLDETHGFHPHTTWSDCTFKNALALLDGVDAEIERIGVLRTLHTRHGAGPFPTEDAEALPLVEGDHNRIGEWQEALRAGPLDLVLARYALDVIGGVDGLSMTYADRIPTQAKFCLSYRDGHEHVSALSGDESGLAHTRLLSRVTPLLQSASTASFCDVVSEILRVPLRLLSYGPMATDKVRP